MCYFWWCHFLCRSAGITNPTDQHYLFPLDACGAGPSGNDDSHTPWGFVPLYGWKDVGL